jgi:B12-binding domain/radical SAM domain protein
VVAWSFYSPSLGECAAEMQALRARVGTGWASLAGGVHATAEPLDVLRAGFDRVCVGEGEHAIRAAARALVERGSIDDVRGFARLDGDRIVLNGRAEPVADLATFPPFAARHQRYGAIEITRGCIYACSFCQTPFLAKARFRHRAAADVARWSACMAAEGLRDVRFVSPTSFSFGSDDASVRVDRIEELLARVRAAIGPRGRLFFGTFPSEVRPEHVTPEVLRVVARYADNRNLILGGQSGSARMLDAAHRGHDVEAIERGVRVALENGFQPNVDFLFGMPGEEEADVAATLDLLERLTALGARAHVHTFLPLPGTPFRHGPAGSVGARTRARLDALQGAGRVYGSWRQQEILARTLAARRAAPR